MKQLKPDCGIPRTVLLMMAVVAGLTVANLYYNQPLLEEMRHSLGIGEQAANLITVVTQGGYAAGLMLVVPLADMVPRRLLVGVCMAGAVAAAVCMAVAQNAVMVWAASAVLGVCSVVPQMFIPVAGQFSRPEDKARNMGIVLSGLLTGILGARVVSGYLGEWIGWRLVFGAAAVVMVCCLAATLMLLPQMKPTFAGSYAALMRTVGGIVVRHRRIRLYSLRGACSFGSMMAIWSCMAFHLAGAPFHASSDKVGMLGLCGIAGALAASGTGRYVSRFGIQRMSLAGAVLQLTAWAVAWLFGNSYTGLVCAIILVDIGAQFNQLSNQSGCLHEVPQAANRANTVFMTTFFIGGSLSTLCAGAAWTGAGWSGVCLTGTAFALAGLGITIMNRKKQ